jgi:regulatory protein
VNEDRPRRAARTPKAPRTVKARAVAHLARREYSRAELRAVLLKGGATSDEVDGALEDLTQQGLLSDARFAHAVVRQKSGGYSRRAISKSLKAKGVTGEAADDALAGHDVDDSAALVALWRRRFGAPPNNDREKARQIRFLQSRGFALSAIFKLLRNPPAADDDADDLPRHPAR